MRPAKTDERESVPHPTWLRTYMFTHRNVSWTVEQSDCIFSVTIAGFPVLDSAIGNRFLHASVGFRQIIHTSHAEFCMPTFSNGLNNSKTACICLYRVSISNNCLSHLVYVGAIFSAVSTCRGFHLTVITWRRSWHSCI